MSSPPLLAMRNDAKAKEVHATPLRRSPTAAGPVERLSSSR